MLNYINKLKSNNKYREGNEGWFGILNRMDKESQGHLYSVFIAQDLLLQKKRED